MSQRIKNTLVYENEDLADIPFFVSKGTNMLFKSSIPY